MQSIMPFDPDVCIECGGRGTQTHHVIFGKNRKWSEKYGLKIRLCYQCHEALHSHANGMDKRYKQMAQRCFEQRYGHEKFMEVFGKNYLEEDK